MSGNLDRLRRVTDLFVEGTVLELGRDETGTPVLLWINKLNPFEDEECRRDGIAARAQRVMELRDKTNAEGEALRQSAEVFDKETLAEALTGLHFDEDYMNGMDDVEGSEEWAERVLYIRRIEELHDDAGIADDAERRKRYTEVKSEYFTAIREEAQKRQDQRQRDLMGLSETELRDTYIEDSITKVGMTEYMNERRVTEIFYSARDCKAVKEDGEWRHRECDHRQTWLSTRAEVRQLPSPLITKIQNALTELTVDRRTAGNLDAPTSSSESLEQPSSPEESTPSIPVVTPPVAVAT